MRRAIFTLTVGLVGTLWAGTAAAQDGAALVLETSGVAVPAVKPYAEIRAGTAVTLTGDARLVLLHYRTCRTVTLVGGRVGVGADTYTVVGSATVRETQGRCPRPVTLKADGEVVVGGVVTRSIVPPLAFGPEPSFVLVGARAGDFAAVRVSRDGAEVLMAPLDGPRFRWPPGARALAPGAVYNLALLPAGGGAPLTLRFRVTAPEPAGEPVTIIRLE